MKSVESFITTLLFEHDCVVVPGLGGFFTVRTEAAYEPDAHKFKAPGKRPGFNPALTHNDGLLIKTIAEQSGKSYDEAKAHVTQFTKNIHAALNSNRGVSLSGLGTITRNSINKPVFTPDESINFDTSTHGLISFHAAPLKKGENKTETKSQAATSNMEVQNEQTLQSKPQPVEKHKGKRISLAVAALVILLLAGSYLGWLLTFTEITNPSRQFAAADLNPFAEKICDLYEPRKKIPLFLQSDWGSDQNPVQLKSNYARLFLTDDSEAFIPVKTHIQSKTIHQSPQQKAGFYIMAGAFKSKRNADQFVIHLKAQGYSGVIVDRKNNLYRVASAQANSRKQAEIRLQEVRTQINSGAWILAQ